MAKKELANVEPFLALQPKGLELITANLELLRHMKPWEMDKATMPSGSGPAAWSVPSLDEDEPDAVKSLEGIILHFQPDRRYYMQGLSEGGVAGPPDCWSGNGIEGIGNPGGVCEICPLNQWGSGKNGGKACPENRQVFLLQQKGYLPLLVQVPTTSVKPLNQYLMRLVARGQAFHDVVTSFSLGKAVQRSGGIAYSKLVAKKVRDLSDEEQTAVKALAARFKPASQ